MKILQAVGVSALFSMVLGLGLGVTEVQAQSGSLEPPGTAVNGSGDPVATTQTQQSWDQTLPASERFKLVMGGAAVLDKETGLVWEQSPLTTEPTWSSARFQCTALKVGDREGWRLPSLHELASLVDPTNTSGNPALPAGHPFSNVQSSTYWSATTDGENPTGAWVVSFNLGGGFITIFPGDAFPLAKTSNNFAWCVRGGSPGPSVY